MKKQKKFNTQNKNCRDKKQSGNKSESEREERTQNPYEIKQSEVLGRYLVASKNLNAGEIVLSEQPLVIGPCQEAKPLCIGCYSDIDLKDPQTFQRCPYCSWPLCSINCSGLHKSNGHSAEECKLLSKSLIREKCTSDFKDYFYALTPFRCLTIRETNSSSWKVLKEMESHTEFRKKVDKLWDSNKRLAVDVIRKSWGFTKFSEDEIHFVCGILEVNAFEITLSFNGSQPLQAIYPTAFLFAHDCIPNTNHSNDDKFQLTIRTTKSIGANEKITVTYAYILQPTLKRRKHLRDTKFFSCTCQRCSDPTELGTFLSAIKCTKCNGFLLPENPLNDDSQWKCNSSKCAYAIPVYQIIPVLEKLFEELDSINGNDVNGYEKFYLKCTKMFHENHYLSLSALHCLSQLYGKGSGYLINDLTDEQLERKVDICKTLLKIFEILEPGMSKQRGILLYELHAALMVTLRRKFQNQKIPKKEIKIKIKEILKHLEEADSILSKEPEHSSEGQMAEASKEGIKSLQDWLNLIN